MATVLFLHGCDRAAVGSATQDGERFVVSNVNVVDVAAKSIVAAKDLVIADGRIVEIRDHEPGPGVTFDAGGAYVVAGLYDAHVHIDTSDRLALMLPQISGMPVVMADIDDDLVPYLAYGITSIVVLNGNDAVLAARDRAGRAGAFMPRIISSSPILDGPETTNPVHRAIASPEDGRRAVSEARLAGYDLIKTYHIADAATRNAIIARAGELQLPVAGHLPPGMPLDEAIVPGFSNVAHAEEITRNWDGQDEAYIDRAIELMAQSNVSFTPNLVAYREIADEISDLEGHLESMDQALIPPLARVYASRPFNGYVADFGGDDVRERAAAYFRRTAAAMDELTLLAHERGVTILAGSDSGNPTMFPGQSLYRELSLLQAAGLDGYDALEAATINVARLLREDDERGSIEVGKIADLVLFRVNPVTRTRLARDDVLAVVRNGTLFDPVRIAAETARVSASYDIRARRYREAAQGR